MSYNIHSIRNNLIDIQNATTEIKETALSPIELIEHLDFILQLSREALDRLREDEEKRND
jgi:hypothetical protein